MGQNPKWLLVRKALVEALQRLETTRPGDVEHAFAAVGEALWWTVVLDEYLEDRLDTQAYARDRDADPAGQLLDGLRYGRNAIGHRAVVVELLEVRDIYTDTYSDFYGEWCWRAVRRTRAQGRDVYESRMKGTSARETLRDILSFFDGMIREHQLVE